MKMGGKGGKEGGAPPPSGPAMGGMMGPDQMERTMQSMKTLTDLVLFGIQEGGKLIEKLAFCMNENRPITQAAITSAYRQYKDRLTAKLWECETPMLQVASNCTDVQFSDIDCIMKGMYWSDGFKMDCIMACMPEGLTATCNLLTRAQGNMMNTMTTNSNLNNRNNNFNNNPSSYNNNPNTYNNNNNNNNNNFYDPFGNGK